MTHDHRRAAQLASIGMSAAERREAIAYVRRGEFIADLILGVVRFLRRAVFAVRSGLQHAFAGLSARLRRGSI